MEKKCQQQQTRKEIARVCEGGKKNEMDIAFP